MRKTPAILKGPGNAAAVASFLALILVLDAYSTLRLVGRIPPSFSFISAGVLIFYAVLLPFVVMKKRRVFFVTSVAGVAIILGNLATWRHNEVIFTGADLVDALTLLGAGYLAQLGLIFYSVRALRERGS